MTASAKPEVDVDALHVARLARHIEGDGLAFLERHEDRVLDAPGGVRLAEMSQHHARR